MHSATLVGHEDALTAKALVASDRKTSPTNHLLTTAGTLFKHLPAHIRHVPVLRPLCMIHLSRPLQRPPPSVDLDPLCPSLSSEPHQADAKRNSLASDVLAVQSHFKDIHHRQLPLFTISFSFFSRSLFRSFAFREQHLTLLISERPRKIHQNGLSRRRSSARGDAGLQALPAQTEFG